MGNFTAFMLKPQVSLTTTEHRLFVILLNCCLRNADENGNCYYVDKSGHAERNKIMRHKDHPQKNVEDDATLSIEGRPLEPQNLQPCRSED